MRLGVWGLGVGGWGLGVGGWGLGIGVMYFGVWRFGAWRLGSHIFGFGSAHAAWAEEMAMQQGARIVGSGGKRGRWKTPTMALHTRLQHREKTEDESQIETLA